MQRDRRLSVVPAIRARIRVGYETDRSQLLQSPRDSNNEPHVKFQRFWLLQYQDRRLSAVPAIRARIRVRYGTDRIDPSFCIFQESLIMDPHAKFQPFWLLQYRDRCLSVVPAIRARIRVGYETDRPQVLHSPRKANDEPPCKVSALLVMTIQRSPLISGSGDLGSYSGWIRN